jgi:hypothetical protein
MTKFAHKFTITIRKLVYVAALSFSYFHGQKFFQKYHCLKLKIFNFNIFSDGKFVSANHILQNFLSTEYFPECKWAFNLEI